MFKGKLKKTLFVSMMTVGIVFILQINCALATECGEYATSDLFNCIDFPFPPEGYGDAFWWDQGIIPLFPAEMGNFEDPVNYTGWYWYTKEQAQAAGLGAVMYDPGTKEGWNAWLPNDPLCENCPPEGYSYAYYWEGNPCSPATRPDLWEPRKEIIDAGYEMTYKWYNFREYEDGRSKTRIEFKIDKLASGFQVVVPAVMWSRNMAVDPGDPVYWGIVSNVIGDQPDTNGNGEVDPEECGEIMMIPVIENFDEPRREIEAHEIESVEIYKDGTYVGHYTSIHTDILQQHVGAKHDGVKWNTGNPGYWKVLYIEDYAHQASEGTYVIDVTLNDGTVVSGEIVVDAMPQMPMPSSESSKTIVTKKGKVVETGSIVQTLFLEEREGYLIATWNETPFTFEPLPEGAWIDSRVQIFAGVTDWYQPIPLYLNSKQSVHMGMSMFPPSMVEMLTPYSSVQYRLEFRYIDPGDDFQYRTTTKMLNYTLGQ